MAKHRIYVNMLGRRCHGKFEYVFRSMPGSDDFGPITVTLGVTAAEGGGIVSEAPLACDSGKGGGMGGVIGIGLSSCGRA
jgi:hypothetical protein